MADPYRSRSGIWYLSHMGMSINMARSVWYGESLLWFDKVYGLVDNAIKNGKIKQLRNLVQSKAKTQ